MNYFAGLDLSMEETRVCVVDEAGRLIHEARVASEPVAIKKALDRHLPDRVVIETGRMASGRLTTGHAIVMSAMGQKRTSAG